MRYIIPPAPITVRHRNGDAVTEDVVDAAGRLVRGPVAPPMTIYAYAEAWWQSEKMNAGGYRGRQLTAKLVAAFDEARDAKAPFIALEDAEWERLRGVVEEAQYFKLVTLEIQCVAFVEAVLSATPKPPATETLPELPDTIAANGTAQGHAQ